MTLNPNPVPAELENLANQITYQSDKFTNKIIFERDSQKALLFAFSAGQELKTHTTPLPALLIVVEGSCLFHINGISQTLTTGAIISIPAQVPHSLSATSNFKMLLIR
ncbi:MAG: cupin [Cytophagales bacterium CG18_big_fil_WC_8_21_14_2_50_42_9]|nr:MAG: cupin [Cytophagales bacterium CG18_big_fil_WC_8_21_14_2_50_42_9]